MGFYEMFRKYQQQNQELLIRTGYMQVFPSGYTTSACSTLQKRANQCEKKKNTKILNKYWGCVVMPVSLA